MADSSGQEMKKKAARKNNYCLTAKGRRITTSIQMYTGKEVLG